MTARTRSLTAGTATLAAAVAALGVVVLGSSDAEEPAAVRAECARQSSHNYPARTFTDPRNLVAGPLVLVGGGTFTDAATARKYGGNKFPVLVRAGHTVTLSLPRSERRTVSLGYGPLPQGDVDIGDGHRAVTFVACSADESLSTAGRGRVTFWSGFVMTSAPRCVALEIRVQGQPAPLRRSLELGRRCAKPPPLRGCADHVEAGKPLVDTPRPGEVVIGPLRFTGLAGDASPRAFAVNSAGDLYRVKAGVGVPAGVRATLSIARGARSRAALNYAPRVPGKPRPRTSAAVRFEACAADHPAFSYDGPVGPITGFSGDIDLERPGCLALEVRVAGRPTVRARVPFGVRRC